MVFRAMLFVVAALVWPWAEIRAAPAEPTGNLVANPGFEEYDAAGPRAWSFARHKGNPTSALDTAAPHAGTRCAVVEAPTENDTGVWLQAVAPAKDAKVYRLSAWIKTSPKTTASLSASYYSKENKWIGADYRVAQASDMPQWRRCGGYFAVAPETAYLKIGLWVNYGNRGAGTAWFDDVELTTAQAIPPVPYVSPNAPPIPTEADTARGFIPFVRNYLDLMPPAYTPSGAEIQDPLSAFCSLGEYEPLSVGVYALRDLKNVRAVVSALRSASGATIPPDAVDVRSVRLLYKRSHYSMNDRMLVPAFLEKKPLADAPKGESRQFWITIHVPPDAHAAMYEGTVTITADGAGAATMPVRLEVLPIRLKEAKGIGFGKYDWPPRSPEEISSEVRFRDMRAHGMTTVGLCGNLGAPFEMVEGKGRAIFDGSSGFEKVLDAYQRAGFPEPIIWLMGGDVKKFALQQGPIESDAFARAYKGVIESVIAEGKRRGWPEIIFQPEDEVFAHEQRFESCFRCLKIIKEIPGARTEMDGPNVNLERSALSYPFTDVLVLAYGPLIYNRRVYDRQEWRDIMAQSHKDGKLVYYYNFDTTGWHPESMRFAFGLYVFATGADGILNWAYAGRAPGCYDDFKGPKGTTTFFYPPTDEEEGGPSIGWEGVREGVDDYRYIHTLQEIIAKCEASADENVRRQAAEAKLMLQQLADSVDISQLRTNMSMQGQWASETLNEAGEFARTGSFKLPVPLALEDYNAVRRRVADWIVKLQRFVQD